MATKMDLSGYVQRVDDVYRVAGTRVSLDSLVSLFLDGRSPESIAQSFPVLTLEQVYGALTYYLAHRPEIDAYLARQNSGYEGARRESHDAHRPLVERLRSAHRQQSTAAS
jgi:uncharacterized protein (DUF433 family)